MEKDMVSLNVSNEIVRPIIEKKVAAAIVESLGGADLLIEKMVSAALSVKVDRDGNRPKYSSDGKFDFVEAMSEKAIRESAREVMKKWIEEHKDKIKDAIIKEMVKPATNRKIAKAFAETAVKSIAVSWKPVVNIEFKRDPDY